MKLSPDLIETIITRLEMEKVRIEEAVKIGHIPARSYDALKIAQMKIVEAQMWLSSIEDFDVRVKGV